MQVSARGTLPHLDVGMAQLQRNLDTVNPGVQRILLSARTGEGIDEWCSWLHTHRSTASPIAAHGAHSHGHGHGH